MSAPAEWAMKQAQFQPDKRGLVDASELLQFAVGDKSVRGFEQAKADESVYRYDINGIDCADARLIAAAPDLLAALKEMVRMCDAFGDTDYRVKAIAAIAKAEGAQS